MNLFRRKRSNQTKAGCGSILLQGLLITLLLIVNGLFVKTFMLADRSWGDEIRISQAIQFLVPIAMIFAELWIFDSIFARTTKARS